MAKVNDYAGSQYKYWIRLYDLTFLVGVAWSFVLFYILNIVAPAQGLYEDTPFVATTMDSPLKNAEVLELELKEAKTNGEHG